MVSCLSMVTSEGGLNKLCKEGNDVELSRLETPAYVLTETLWTVLL